MGKRYLILARDSSGRPKFVEEREMLFGPATDACMVLEGLRYFFGTAYVEHADIYEYTADGNLTKVVGVY